MPYFHINGAKLDHKPLLMVRSSLPILNSKTQNGGTLPPNRPSVKGSKKTAMNCL